MSDQFSYESILESISGGFFALNNDYRITYWNSAAEKGTGLERSDVLGQNVFEVFPNARGAMLGEKYRLAMDTKTFQSFETSYKDERFEAWYDIRIYPAETGLSVFFQDITEKKRQERQREILVALSHAINSSQHLDGLCREGAEHIARLFDVDPRTVALFLYDGKAGEIRLVAPALFDMDFPPEIVHQRVGSDQPHLAARVAFRKEPHVTDEIARATVSGLIGTHPDLAELRTLIVVPLLVQGELQGVLEVPTVKGKDFIKEDMEILSVVVNELATGMSRKRLIDELRRKNLELEAQTQKTQEATDTLKKFLAMFSHELRSPLNSIIGFSDLLATQVEELKPDALREFMKNINESGKHLQHIINDILDLSKIEAGKMELHIASYPVSYFEESVRRVLAGPIGEKRIALEFALSPEFEEIVVDQTRFKQILMNLVSNAVKFSSDGGTIRISSERVGNDLEFRVSDEGVGIRPEELIHLFKPFKQAQGGKHLNRQGVGLGLAITKKLIEMHGGTIWIDSTWGEGTTVSFRIPLIVDVNAERIMQSGMLLEALRQENPPLPEGKKPLALIVEDAAQASELLKLHIESGGYEVVVARDGGEAVEMAKRLRPSIITLDLMLPVKDGWQVLKELKQHPLCKHIPIIIVSIIEEKSLGFSLGAADYFVKPVSKDELIKSLDRFRLVRTNADRRPTVLVIDDDRAATDLVQVILENEGYRVLKSNHAREGVELAVQERPDLIILDLVMPEMSGFHVAYELRHIPATRFIPIIVLTSMEMDENDQQNLSEYVTGLMSKSSFTKRDLLREIAQIRH
jgi:PAS domain S-box-containing protein